MQTTTFLFTNEEDLRGFMDATHSNFVEVNMNALTVICPCDDAEIELAINAFHAQIIDSGKQPI